MNINDLLVDGFGRIQHLLHLSLDGLTDGQLHHLPTSESNSIAWLAWHIGRGQDFEINTSIRGIDQVWIKDVWYAKFGKAADPLDHGTGNTSEQVAAFRSDTKTLLAYYDAVHEKTIEFVKSLSESDLDRELNEPQWDPLPTVGVRLVSIMDDGVQHAGQAAYIRGMVVNRHWFPA